MRYNYLGFREQGAGSREQRRGKRQEARGKRQEARGKNNVYLMSPRNAINFLGSSVPTMLNL
ncbi:hypothetical protein BJP34_34270 [Moorena producens PAL-8-15-08-1]|uniref:Uncharacterized protein n=1 Tax=Moorena producens PAL-8-15-08-1 TaxID=1458985 RepID=A0A1D8U1R8_9CYAN|nr:hypothetical protein BJP34_34270 [Moorena producens PAL-8-15-08-1]